MAKKILANVEITSSATNRSGLKTNNMTSSTPDKVVGTTFKNVLVDENGELVVGPENSGNNIYNTDGTLTSDRSVTQNDKTLGFYYNDGTNASQIAQGNGIYSTISVVDIATGKETGLYVDNGNTFWKAYNKQITQDQAKTHFEFDGDPLWIDGTPGASGQVLTTQGPGLPPIWSNNASGANNGLDVDAGKVVLGQDIGEAGDPAKLLSNREIPMDGKNLSLKNTGGEFRFEGDGNVFFTNVPAIPVLSTSTTEPMAIDTATGQLGRVIPKQPIELLTLVNSSVSANTTPSSTIYAPLTFTLLKSTNIIINISQVLDRNQGGNTNEGEVNLFVDINGTEYFSGGILSYKLDTLDHHDTVSGFVSLNLSAGTYTISHKLTVFTQSGTNTIYRTRAKKSIYFS